MNKKGVSEIIGYILLTAIVITISIFVYTWLKSYVPQDSIACPDGVSVSLVSYTYNCTADTLNLTLQNTGTFNISGYFIHASNDPTQQIDTVDLTGYYAGSYKIVKNAVYYYTLNAGNINPSLNIFSPQQISGGLSNYFNLGNYTGGKLVSIEITPLRFIQLNGKTAIASCDDAKIDLPVTCS
jgi:flagellin-like protein